MLRSMTGFGRSELKSAHGAIRVEIKTTNHKFLEISSRLPNHLSEYEDATRKKVSDHLRRGKVFLLIQSPDPAVYSSALVLNEDLAKEVFHKIQRLKAVLKLTSEQGMILKEVLHYPDVLTKDAAIGPKKTLFREVEKALDLAIVSLQKSRNQEGRALEKDFISRMAGIHRALKTIEKQIPITHKDYRQNLERRMKEFIKDDQIDKSRLTLEVSLYAKSSDISEEVTRLKSHLDGLKKALQEDGELGRKIDFMGQEMIREANTIGSKSNNVVIANQVIEIKSAIEKIREQSQNVE